MFLVLRYFLSMIVVITGTLIMSIPVFRICSLGIDNKEFSLIGIIGVVWEEIVPTILYSFTALYILNITFELSTIIEGI